MALGSIMAGQSMQQAPTMLAQAMDPTAVRSAAQPNGLGAMMAKLQQNPAALQMLLATGAQLLNPTSFQAPGGRIANAVSSGVSGYNEMQANSEDRAFKRKMLEQQNTREDRKVDLSERELDQADEQRETQREQWLQSFGMEEDKLEAQRKLWEAQANKYNADAAQLRDKMEKGDTEKLTGEERIINNMQQIFVDANVPEDEAYLLAFDVFNRSQESEAKAIAAVTEKLAMWADTEEGRQMMTDVIGRIKESFRSASDYLKDQKQGGGQEVSQEEISTALQQMNAANKTNITWEQMTEIQRDRLRKWIINNRNAGGQE